MMTKRVVFSVLMCLWLTGMGCGGKQAGEEARRLLEAGDLGAAATAIQKELCGNPLTIQQLIADEDPRVRLGCLILLDQDKLSINNVEPLKTIAGEKESLEQVLSAKILLKRVQVQYLAVLIKDMSSANYKIAVAAASSIPSDIRIEFSLDLVAGAKSQFPAVRGEVAAILDRDVSENGYLLLLQMTSDKDADVRMNATGSLCARIKEKDRAVVERLLKDPDSGVRDNAKHLLQCLDAASQQK